MFFNLLLHIFIKIGKKNFLDFFTSQSLIFLARRQTFGFFVDKFCSSLKQKLVF